MDLGVEFHEPPMVNRGNQKKKKKRKKKKEMMQFLGEADDPETESGSTGASELVGIHG